MVGRREAHAGVDAVSGKQPLGDLNERSIAFESLDAHPMRARARASRPPPAQPRRIVRQP